MLESRLARRRSTREGQTPFAQQGSLRPSECVIAWRRGISCRALTDIVLVFLIIKVSRCCRGISPSFNRVGLPNLNKPVRLPLSKRPEKHGIHDGENGGIGSDAQRQRDRSHYGEPWPFRQHPKSITNVPPK